MALVRAFTTKRNKPDHLTNVHMGRAASQRGGRLVRGLDISSPVALVSTTNPLSYEAPDIAGTKKFEPYHHVPSSSGSSHSAEDSDASTLSINSHTDASSVEASSPVMPEPEPNHLSCYFKPNVGSSSPGSSPSVSTRTSLVDAPQIPQRIPSHSKKAHERVHRKRSVQRIMSPHAGGSRRQSLEMFQAPPVDVPRENMFGNELAQLDEVAEEFSHAVRDAEANADAHYMESHGLAYFGASDYLTEIHSLLYDVLLAEEPAWI
ncbi:Hypothetical predicted protein [Lecanosticta acicola]|uniref:Uncharacterized protein n=1 Tax=Lecanosticta acicola TaxID=111012 RepID=A0AAI8Z3P6_9PEZI|nr:Hypothetical predicted protein [Lecanosticta acicola]